MLPDFSDRASRPDRARSRRTPRPRSVQFRPACEPLEFRSLLSTFGGTWSAGPVAPGGLGTMLMLTDGSVIAQGGEYWYRLTPNASGSYATGSWSAEPQSMMNTQRLYFGSAVLPSGKLFLVGGEYSTPAGTQDDFNQSETFDPLTNTWGFNATFPQPYFGDDPVEVLPDGNVLAGFVNGPQTYIYSPATDTWANGPTKVNDDQSDEETWTRLPNGDILTYDIFSSIASGTFEGEIYNPNTNAWSATTNSTTSPPSQLSSSSIGYELGPSELLPDGRVFQVGANGNTAFYDYRTNTWSAGPQVRDSSNLLFGADDAPSAMLPGGQVVFAADAGPRLGTFSPPTELFVFDPTTNAITQIPTSSLPSGLQSDLAGEGAYVTRMIMLPTGQLALSDSSSQLWLFTPGASDAPAANARPTVTNVSYNATAGQFTLTGTRLNGVSEGSSYGDDVSNATNYPIVQLKTLAGADYFGYSTGWTPSVSAPGDTTSQSVQFVLPDGVPAGTYLLTVAANGVTSNPLFYNVTAAEATNQPSPLTITGGSQYTEAYDYFDYEYYGTQYNNYYPYNYNHSNNATGNYSQYSYGNYFNSTYANAYGDTNSGQQLNYYGYTGVSSIANAYANPVERTSNYFGTYAYSESDATDQLTFTLATESQATFAYNTGASVINTATSSGLAYAYADGYGEVYNTSTGASYYSSDNAYVNYGGPFTYYGAGSFTIDLPAGTYDLYSSSYVYAYSYTNLGALASAYNGVALTQIVPVAGSDVVLGSGGSGGTGAPPLGSGGGPSSGSGLPGGGGAAPAALSGSAGGGGGGGIGATAGLDGLGGPSLLLPLPGASAQPVGTAPPPPSALPADGLAASGPLVVGPDLPATAPPSGEADDALDLIGPTRAVRPIQDDPDDLAS